MQRNVITDLALLLIGAGVWLAARQRTADSALIAAMPEEVVQTMLDAGRRGDATAYLACFADTLRPSLEATRQQMGEARFREYLMESQAPVMGVATTRQPSTRPEAAQIEVEFVLRDKNQRQTIGLKNDGGRWRIDSMGQSVYMKPAIPYGTKFYDEPAATNRPPSRKVVTCN